MNALAGLDTPVPCYVDNQAFTIPDAGQEYATINLQFGQTTSKVLTGNLERLRGSLVIECFTAKNTGPARAQEIITPVMIALNDLNSCSGYKEYGPVGWVGDMTGPAFFALDDAPFYMVRLSVAVTARYEAYDLLSRLVALEQTHDATGGHDSGTYVGVDARDDSIPLPDDFEARLTLLESKHDVGGGHDSGVYGLDREKAEARDAASFSVRLKRLEQNHDKKQGHNSGNY